MVTLTRPTHTRLRLSPFEAWHAFHVAGWVESPEELRWLAPSTRHPLSASKVLAWRKPGSAVVVPAFDDDDVPIGYAELNPMHRHASHYWLGHVVLRPDLRGCGLGAAFVRSLVRYSVRELSATRLSLIVFPDNGPAVRCYRRVGFHVAGFEDHRFNGFGRRHRLLRLELDASREW